MIEVIDRSTDTGLRAQILSDTTGTAVMLTGDEWEQLVREIKSGLHDDVAKQPRIPFIY